MYGISFRSIRPWGSKIVKMIDNQACCHNANKSNFKRQIRNNVEILWARKRANLGLDFSLSNEEDNDSAVEKNLRGNGDENTKSAKMDKEQEEDWVKRVPRKGFRECVFSSESYMASCVDCILPSKRTLQCWEMVFLGFQKRRHLAVFVVSRSTTKQKKCFHNV